MAQRPLDGFVRSVARELRGGATAQLVRVAPGAEGGGDVIVHNAGVTRDRTLARKGEAEWDMPIAVNLAAPQRLTAPLLAGGTLREGGRIVCVSVGQRDRRQPRPGQLRDEQGGDHRPRRAHAARLAPERTINAAAPGFIETSMTRRRIRSWHARRGAG